MPEKMSTSSQNNGKKSSNSSIVNTPSSTPLTGIVNGNTQASAQSSPPPNNNAPKYGTLVPNRIFVGGISANTTESELMQLFSSYGTVKAAKIIQDRAGVSKGYGFITFESEDDAKRPLREAENIVLRERKLNIAPAIKKQPFSRAFDASSPPAVAAGNPAQFFFPPGAAMPYFQGGVAYYPQPAPAAPGDPSAQQPVYQPPPVYPSQTGPPQAATYPSMMFPAQTIYMPQQYPMPMPYEYNYYQSNGAPPSAQYMVGSQGGPGGPQCPPMPPSGSPPRPPCYSQQMPAYNPGDPMFYNLPVYGATMEVPPVYTEAFDLGAGGPYSEDSYSTMADVITQDLDLSLSLPFITNTPNDTNNYITTNNNNNHHHHHHPVMTPQQPPVGGNDPGKAYQLSNGETHERNSNTPVVSLLSIEQQQEKDFVSMRGGRRNRNVPSSPKSSQGFMMNGYGSPSGSYNMAYHPPYGLFNNNRANGVNSANRGKNRTRVYEKRSNDQSSLRTDSNSSASCVDENKNEERTRTNVNTPPPAPYSPLKILHNAASREFHGITRYTTYKPPYHHHNNNNNNDKTKHPTADPAGNSVSSNVSSNGVSRSNSPAPQVHVTATQGFAPQARRNRRSIRRSGPAGVSEIGAGDAPLPNDEVCKKFDTLKL